MLFVTFCQYLIKMMMMMMMMMSIRHAGCVYKAYSRNKRLYEVPNAVAECGRPQWGEDVRPNAAKALGDGNGSILRVLYRHVL